MPQLPVRQPSQTESPKYTALGNPILVEEKPAISTKNESIAQKQFALNNDEIVEPKFETSLLDFDINKFGAPPPRARLSKEEQDKIERRKAEKIRLQNMKEQSAQKAKESFARSNTFSPSPTITTPLPREESPAPAKFELPDIAQFQPPPPAQPRVQGLEQVSPTPVRMPVMSPMSSSFTGSSGPAGPSLPPRLPSRTSTVSTQSNEDTPLIPKEESFERAPQPIPKKAPPPKPKKLSENQLESIAAKKKAPPPPPKKKPQSSATGSHILELQGKLGNLNLN